MKFARREVLAGLGAGLGLLPSAVRAQSGSAQRVRIGYVPVEVCAEAFYGIELGIFRRAGLDARLQVFTSPGAIAAALAGGTIDVGVYDMAGMITAHAHRVPLVCLATSQVFNQNAPIYSAVVAPNSPIHSARDFAGAFAVSSVNNIAALGTLVWIDRNGGDSKGVKFVELPFPVMADSVERGTVNGAVPVEPFLTAAAARGLRTIPPLNGIARSYAMSCWTSTRDWADANRAVAARFTRAIYEAGRWGNRNHDASIPILARYTKVPSETIRKMHRGTFAESTDPGLSQPVVDAAAAYGLIPSRFSAEELYYRASS